MVIRKGKKKVEIKGSLPVVYFREGDAFVSYTPALDLSSYGVSFEEARHNLLEAVGLFLEELVEQSTIDEVLEECGWQKISRPSVHWVPPAFICQENLPLNA